LSDRQTAIDLDRRDPLSGARDDFLIDDSLVYMDGNSLGRLPRRAVDAIGRTVAHEWGSGLVGSWRTDWIDLPTRVGDRLGALIGAAPGETLISDQTTVNLYKLAAAALDATGRTDIVSTASNFPSDLYVLSEVARANGGRLRLVDHPVDRAPSPRAVAGALGAGVALVALSHVDYRSGAIADMAGIGTVAGDAGALALWDLSHSVGVYPVDLTRGGADLAVGCTYKYLNGGPGSPGFLFVRSTLHDSLRQPIPGWFGHADQFAFLPGYEPAPGIARFAVGTPPIVSLRGAEAGIEVVLDHGLDAIRAKSISLTGYLIDLYDQRLAGRGFDLLTPRRPEHRGGHVGLAHASAWQVAQALIAREVIPDFRAPDVIRLGPSPLYTTHLDVWHAVEALVQIVDSDEHRGFPEPRGVVT
jgi:kynureninase